MSPRSPSGQRRPPSLRDVAELAGVSIKTVSNVVNDYPHVRDSTRERVREAIAEVGYRPQAAAQQLRTGASRLITLAVPSLAFSYFSELAQTFIDEAQSRGLTILLHSTSAGVEAERRVLGGFDRLLGDGVIFNPLHLDEAAITGTRRLSQPTVFIGEHMPDQIPEGADYVRIDNVAATADATSHLIEQGRSRIAFLGALPHRGAERPHGSDILRLEGFRTALERHDLDPDAAPVEQVTHWHRRHGADAVAALLAREPGVDGIVCANDDLAIGVLAGLRDLGRRVPDDIAVIGYDDTPDAPFVRPSLSTVSPDTAFLTRTALDFLTERIQGHDGPPRRVTAPHEVVARESTGGPLQEGSQKD